MSFLNTVLSDVEKAGGKIKEFLQDVVNGERILQSTYGTLSGPVLAAVSAVYYDAVKSVAAAKDAAVAAEGGDISTAVTLSETTLSLIKKTVEDAKAGVKTVVADFEALNIKL